MTDGKQEWFYILAYKVGAINWGLVQGKTNTIYAWDEPIPSGEEPQLWFHDIFRPDGSSYKQSEIDAIKLATRSNWFDVQDW